MKGLARLVTRLRYLIVAFWIALTATLTFALPTVQEAQVGALGDLIPNDAAAVQAEVRAFELFAFPLLSRTLVVKRDPDGLPAPSQARIVGDALAVNRAQYEDVSGIAGILPITNALGRPPFSRERSTTAIDYLFFPADIGSVGRVGLAGRYRDRYVGADGAGFTGITGALPARAAQAQQIEDALPLVELATVLLVFLAVGLHFRSLVAPLVNLAAVAVAYLVAIRAMAAIGKSIGVSVPSEVEPVIVVLLFGVLTDYTIFFLSRFRRRLADGESARAASESTTGELLPIIVTAGLTIVMASAALAAARLGFLQAFGPGMAIAMLIGLAVAVTFVPAAMAVLGHRMFWPSRTAVTRVSDTGRERLPLAIRLAVRRPVVVAAGVTVLLLAMGTGVLRLDLGNPLIRGLPESAEARVAYAQASRGFAPGVLSPTVAVVEGRELTSRRPALARLQRALARQPGVATVVGPADQPFDQTFGAALSPTGDAARYFVVLRSDPLGSAAIRALRRIEARMPTLLRGAGLGGAAVSFAGDTALSEEIVGGTARDSRRVMPLIALAVFVVLAVFLRALLAPLYLLAASMLALVASLGATVYVFQDLLGYGELSYFVPVAGAVLLVALGSDYNVFLVGRIWQEARTRPLREAIEVGGARATTAISVAGVILAASFALLALVELRPFRELAFLMAFGLLLDAFLVRTLLVPALMALVGDRGAWPRRMPPPGRVGPYAA
ncbi:MAG: MMPL family transporter [Thermoleophilaceae bacterium]|nr:MMPL family transporter [Thermoleophilaceae bacterium]